MYRDEMYRNFTEKVVDPVHRNVRAAFGKDELIDGVPYQDCLLYTSPPGSRAALQKVPRTFHQRTAPPSCYCVLRIRRCLLYTSRCV